MKTLLVIIILMLIWVALAHAEPQGQLPWSYSEIADAIYRAEGGAGTAHPYGILARYKHTTPRQACINTIAHAYRNWNGTGDFIEYLGRRYCPVGCENDNGTNRYWVKNVKWFLNKGK